MNNNIRSNKKEKQYQKKKNHYSSIPKQLKHPSKIENRAKIATTRLNLKKKNTEKNAKLNTVQVSQTNNST
jgi:hypothetical protein